MKENMLFPSVFKWIGLILFISTFIIFSDETDIDDVSNLSGLYIQLMSFTGLIFMAGSRMKPEDEWTHHIRLNTIKWAILIYIFIRVFFKIMAFSLQDSNWMPDNIQINALLIIHTILFYTRIVIIPFFQKRFNSDPS